MKYQHFWFPYTNPHHFSRPPSSPPPRGAPNPSIFVKELIRKSFRSEHSIFSRKLTRLDELPSREHRQCCQDVALALCQCVKLHFVATAQRSQTCSRATPVRENSTCMHAVESLARLVGAFFFTGDAVKTLLSRYANAWNCISRSQESDHKIALALRLCVKTESARMLSDRWRAW